MKKNRKRNIEAAARPTIKKTPATAPLLRKNLVEQWLDKLLSTTRGKVVRYDVLRRLCRIVVVGDGRRVSGDDGHITW